MTTQVGVLILAECFVSGHPKTKGSLEFVTAKHVREKPGSDRWRKLVADRLRTDALKRSPAKKEDRCGGCTSALCLLDGCAEVRIAGRGDEGTSGPYAGRIGVRIVSFLQVPAQPKPALRNWLDHAMEWLVCKFSGDVDKLARNVLDALTDSGVIVDDAQVVDLFSHKRLAQPGMMPGQQIQVWAIPESASW